MSFFMYTFPVIAAESDSEWTTALRRHVTKAAFGDKPHPGVRIATIIDLREN